MAISLKTPAIVKRVTKPISNRKKGYWIYTATFECVVCGRTTVYKNRRYTPKPEDYWMRNEWNNEACWSHFI